MWDVVLAGVIGTAVGGAAASWAAVGLQSRHDKRHAAVRAVEVARAVELDRVLQRLHGEMSEIDHCVNRLRNGDKEYDDQIRQHARTIRKLARENTVLLGDLGVDSATRFTDQVLVELKSLRSGKPKSEDLERSSTFLRGFLEGLEIGSH